MILFKDVSYKILQLTVMLGNANISNLNIFQSAKHRVAELDLTIYAGIIGTSHFVQIQRDNGQYFTELFACETLENTSKPLCFLPIDELNNTVYLNENSFDYQFQCKKLRYNETVNEITNWVKKEQKNKPFIFLTFNFKTSQQALPTSRTILAIHKTENRFTIKTVHEYQEENAIIVSESEVALLH
jgi:hypothetical protein